MPKRAKGQGIRRTG